MSNIIIPPEHRSAPKQTELDKSIKTAITELRDGTFKPTVSTANFDPTTDDNFRTGTELLEQHPLVQEAMRKLETQVSDKTSNEYLEKAQQLHELNMLASKEFQWKGQERWMGAENEAMRVVNPMTPSNFIHKLRAAGISAAEVPQITQAWHIDKDGQNQLYDEETSDARICLGLTVYQGLVALRAWVNGEYKMVDKLQVPIGPEFTVMRFDEFNVPTTEKYHGWRTAVLALIIREVITEADAEEAFGKVVENEASELLPAAALRMEKRESAVKRKKVDPVWDDEALMQQFHRLNALYWGRRLKVLYVRFEKIDGMGVCKSYRQQGKPDGYGIQIAESTREVRRIWLGTLIHEMVHLEQQNKYTCGLGSHNFNRRMKELAMAGAFNGIW